MKYSAFSSSAVPSSIEGECCQGARTHTHYARERSKSMVYRVSCQINSMSVHLSYGIKAVGNGFDYNMQILCFRFLKGGVPMSSLCWVVDNTFETPKYSILV